MCVELVWWLIATSYDVGMCHQDAKPLLGKLVTLGDRSGPNMTSVDCYWFVLHQHRQLSGLEEPSTEG